jgi:hypothetical protein
MATKEKTINSLLTSVCVEEFKSIGFAKKKEGIFFCKYENDMYLRLGFNISKKEKDVLVINPMFGVGWEPLEGLISKLSGKSYSPYLFASFSSNIGGFMPDNVARHFTFNRESIHQEVVEFSSFLSTVSDNAKNQYSGENAIISGLEKYPPMQQSAERWICTHFLLGDKRKSIELLESETKKLEGAHPVMQQQFKAFADAFISQI